MTVRELIEHIAKEAYPYVKLEVYNEEADYIADNLLKENNKPYNWADMLDSFQTDKSLNGEDDIIKIARRIVVKSEVARLSDVLDNGSINIFDGLEVDDFTFGDGILTVSVKKR